MKFASASFFKITNLLAGMVIVLHLSSCHRSEQPYSGSQLTLPCKVYGASDPAIIGLQKTLNKQGIATISIGQNYLLSIPAGHLFYNQSPRLTWGAYQTLNEVACYLKQFRKVAVQVNSFSSKYHSLRRELSLTRARSRAVGDYLWSQGINARFVFTDGFGSDKPVVSRLSGGDLSPNARVEITFRRVVA